MATLEERLQKLEEAQKELERKATRANDILEIQKIVGIMQHLHSEKRDPEVAEYFAKSAKDQRISISMGSFEGPDAAERMGNIFIRDGKVPTGIFGTHLMCNPIIEVAGDGKTAKASFIAIGFIAMPRNPQTGKANAMWEWNRYGTDFIKEDGKWKFWHHHIYPLFTVGYNQDWAEKFEKKLDPPKEAPKAPPGFDLPPTPLDVFYHPDIDHMPRIPIPLPYETFDPNAAY